MKISVDAQPLISREKSGIGYYGHNLVMELSKLTDAELVLEFFALRHFKEKLACAEQYCTGNVALDYCRWFSMRAYMLLTGVVPLTRSIFFKNRSDVGFYFNYTLPPGVRGKKVVVVHDMVIKDCPETASAKTRMLLNLFLRSSLKRADKIITVSEFSRKRIQHYFDVEDEKIRVVPCGVDIGVYCPGEDGQELCRIKEKYGINGKYLFYLGTLEPRKNILNLIKAYEKFIKGKQDCPKLVISGGKGWLYDKIFGYVEEKGLTEQVIFTGYIEDGEKVPLLRGAEMFCFPSVYEGFGIPILEAMACGTPVLTADAASLPEVGGEACEYCDPLSPDSIFEGLERLWSDPQRRRELSAAGTERAKHFTWEASAQKLMSVFREITT